MMNSDDLDKGKHHSNINLIYEYAEKSLDKLTSSQNTVNTKLCFILSFDAAYIRLSTDLPDNNFVVFTSSNNISLICYSCFLLKIFTYVFLILSLGFCVCGLKPIARGKIILPEELIEKCLNIPEEHYRESIVTNWNETIKELADVRDKKSATLNKAVVCLGIAAIFSSLDMLLVLVLKL